MKSSSSVTTSEAHPAPPSSGDESDLERVKQVAWLGDWGCGSGGYKRGHRKKRDLGLNSATDLPCDSRKGLGDTQFVVGEVEGFDQVRDDMSVSSTTPLSSALDRPY